MNDVTVKKSKIGGKGVFASRNFKKGEIVLEWGPKILKKSEVKKISDEKRHYLYQDDGKDYFLMQPPERYVNHSCNANTEVKNKCDVAIRDIKRGEEITSDYGNGGGSSVSFICKCGSKNCRGKIE